jgi:hypothetical protein
MDLTEALRKLDTALSGEGYDEEFQAVIDGVAILRGAAAADEERMIAAAAKAGIPYYDCDTPDWLAEEVVGLRAELAVYKEALNVLAETSIRDNRKANHAPSYYQARIDAALTEARKRPEAK